MSNDVSKMVKEAAEAAKHAPEHLQEAAFNKAFEALMAQTASGQRADKARTERQIATVPRSKPGLNDEARSIDELKRTDHPEIDHNSTALINSLRLLLAVKNDLDIDGLSGAQIAKVLTEKFRFRITPQAIGQALNGAGKLVDRRKHGHIVLFRIMGPGERHLEGLETGTVIRVKATTRRKKATQKDQQSIQEHPVDVKSKPSKQNVGTRSSVGPASAMNQLLETGYFKKPRSISVILASLKHDAGRSFKANELSPGLLRMLRKKTLKRNKNTDGQYEYSEA